MHANFRPNNRMTHHNIRGPQTSSELEPFENLLGILSQIDI